MPVIFIYNTNSNHDSAWVGLSFGELTRNCEKNELNDCNVYAVRKTKREEQEREREI